MANVRVKYVGKHQQQKILEVDEAVAKDLVRTRQYKFVRARVKLG